MNTSFRRHHCGVSAVWRRLLMSWVTYLLIYITLSIVTRWCRSEDGTNSWTETAAPATADVVMRQRDNFQTSRSMSLPPPRSVSFYDNLCLSEVLADPQSELELILDDLRRNICALDAALNSPSPSTSSQCSLNHYEIYFRVGGKGRGWRRGGKLGVFSHPVHPFILFSFPLLPSLFLLFCLKSLTCS